MASLTTLQPIAIAGNDRAFFCGQTGSGKTYLAMHLLAPLPRVVCVDLKGSETIAAFPWDDPADSKASLRALANGREARVRVRTAEDAMIFMQAAYESGGCIVYIDEVYALIPQGAKTPDVITAIWTRGRELGVGGWAATQRPTWLPLWLVSEATWTFAFRLRMAEDRARMAAYMGEEVTEPIYDAHGFYVSREDWRTPQYYKRFEGDFAPVTTTQKG